MLLRWHFHHFGQQIYPLSSQIWFWFNISNLRIAFDPTRIPALTHFWTLAIEEQFYFLWPAVVRFTSEKTLGLICVIGIFGSIALRALPVVHAWQSVYPDLTYRLTPFRLDGLLLGSLVAILLRRKWTQRTLLRASALGTFCGLVAMAAMLYKTRSVPGYTATAVFFAGLIVLAITSNAVGSVFRLRLLRELGKYSYCMYVIHLWIMGMIPGLRQFVWFFNPSRADYNAAPALVESRLRSHGTGFLLSLRGRVMVSDRRAGTEVQETLPIQLFSSKTTAGLTHQPYIKLKSSHAFKRVPANSTLDRS